MKTQLTQHRAFQSLSDFWQARDSRERVLLLSALGLLLVAVFYLLLIEPAVEGRERLSRSLPQLRQQVAEMQTLAKEAANLPPPSERTAQPITRESLTSSLSNHGITAQNLSVSGETVRLQLTNASFSNLIAWLGAVRSAMLLEVTEANIVAQSQSDMVNATITLRQQASEQRN